MREDFRDIRPTWIAFGWFIGIALTAVAVFALTVADLMRPDTPAERMWISASLVGGFILAGFVVGARVLAAPILHGVGMGLFSLVAWVALNLFLGEPTGMTAWDAIDLPAAATLVFLQTAAAVIGTRLGTRRARSI